MFSGIRWAKDRGFSVITSIRNVQIPEKTRRLNGRARRSGLPGPKKRADPIAAIRSVPQNLVQNLNLPFCSNSLVLGVFSLQIPYTIPAGIPESIRAGNIIFKKYAPFAPVSGWTENMRAQRAWNMIKAKTEAREARSPRKPLGIWLFFTGAPHFQINGKTSIHQRPDVC